MYLLKSVLFVGVIAVLALPAVAGQLHSSIQVPSSGKAESGKAAEAHEEINTARLLKMAKITKEQAKVIASSKFKGKFAAVDLENEDGNLIWSVEIGSHELAIDAGNGKILQVE